MFVMLASLKLISLLALVSHASAQDNTIPSGTNPVKVSSVAFWGTQLTNSCTSRDLGFTGKLGGTWYALFGDTLWCAPGVTNPASNPSGFYGIVRNAMARATNNATMMNFTQLNNDKPVPHPTQFIPFNNAWGEDIYTGYYATSPCATTNTAGVVYYLINLNAGGLKGAGVANIQLQNGNPVVVGRQGAQGFWWNATTTARYGDTAAYRDDNSNYIYALGTAPASAGGWPASQYVYQARVLATNALDLTKYQYWGGRQAGWLNQPPAVYNATTAVMWNVGQGTIYWSPFYKVYMYVHFNGASVAIRTASSPQGPWSGDVSFYTPKPLGSGYIYAPAVHPYMDPSGATLAISYTNDNTVVQVIRATFSK